MEQWVRCSGAALLKVNWEYNKSKHEIDLTIEQVVPPWRTHSTSSSSSSGEGGGSGSLNSDAATAGHANHQGCFQGLLQIRIVEVCVCSGFKILFLLLYFSLKNYDVPSIDAFVSLKMSTHLF